MTDKTLLILLDSLPYSLSHHLRLDSTWRTFLLQSSFGYGTALASALTGKKPKDYQVWNTFYYNPSFLRWPQRIFQIGGTPSLAALKILLKYGYKFDLCQKKNPAEKNAFSVPTVFDFLRQRNRPFLYYNHPWWVTDKCQRLIFSKYHEKKVVEKFKMEFLKYDFSFVHLYELDYLGHKFGPSQEVNDFIKNLGEVIKTNFLNCFDGRIIMFSDHGITPVKGLVDASALANESKVFLDSTLIRSWDGSEEMRSKLIQLPHGRILSNEELTDYNPDHKFGKLIWAADSGYIVKPNFWNKKPEDLKGMHGYFQDDQAFLATNFEIEKKEIYQTQDIFKLLMQSVK